MAIAASYLNDRLVATGQPRPSSICPLSDSLPNGLIPFISPHSQTSRGLGCVVVQPYSEHSVPTHRFPALRECAVACRQTLYSIVLLLNLK